MLTKICNVIVSDFIDFIDWVIYPIIFIALVAKWILGVCALLSFLTFSWLQGMVFVLTSYICYRITRVDEYNLIQSIKKLKEKHTKNSN